MDVIVSEWMGFYLLHESMLGSVLFARDKCVPVSAMISALASSQLHPRSLLQSTNPSPTFPIPPLLQSEPVSFSSGGLCLAASCSRDEQQSTRVRCRGSEGARST